MKRLVCIAAILFFLSSPPLFAQHKVTVDPNMKSPAAPGEAEVVATPAPKAERYDPAKDADKRMAQKISFEGIHARLAAVAASLSQSTGVTIMCGTGKSNWQCRDIPVTVYAKDIPLGTLIRALARATHNVVRSEPLTGGATAYRIYQDPRLTKQFADFENATQDYHKNLVAYNWDWVAGLANVPATEIKPTDGNYSIGQARVDAVRKLADVMNQLGPDYKQQVTSGETVTLSCANVSPKLKGSLLSLFGAIDQLWLAQNPPNANRPNLRTTPLAPDELEKAGINLSNPDWSQSQASGVLMAGTTSPIGLGMPMYANMFRSIDPKKPLSPTKSIPPARPQITEEPDSDVDFPDIASTLAALDTKIDLDDLASKKGLNAAAVLAEAMKRAGASIVIEDFDYFKENQRVPSEILRKGLTLRDALNACSFDYIYKVDQQDSLCVAPFQRWETKHENLVPAQTYDSLAAKLTADGADLEDLLPVMSLSMGQWTEWVAESKDVSAAVRHMPRVGDPLWKFYSLLRPADRRQAATPEGVSMTIFDPAAVTDLLAQYRKFQSQSGAAQVGPKDGPDEQTLATLVLHLRTQTTKFYPQNGGTLAAPQNAKLPRGLDTCYVYSLDIVGMVNNTQQTFAASGSFWQLPFYSKDREAELIASLTAAPAAK